MQNTIRLSPKVCVTLLFGMLAMNPVVAQDDDAAKRESEQQKTKQAQAVSKAVYDRIIKAQEMVDAQDYQGALRSLNNLYNPD